MDRPTETSPTAAPATGATPVSSASPIVVLEKHKPRTLRRALTFVTISCGFWAVWNYCVNGAPRIRYADSMGMGEFGYGLLGAMPHAGLLIQVISSYLMEKYGGRKRIFLIAGITHRAMWILIALIPWIPGVTPDHHWWLLLLMIWATTSLGNLSDPAWLVWMADFIPDRIRGRYFARRGQVGRFVGMAMTLLVGFILDRAMTDAGKDPLILQRTISLLFIVGAVCGMIDIGLFKWVPDEHRRDHTKPINFFQMLAQPLKHPAFRRFLAFRGTLFFGIGYIEVFVWKYLLDDVVKMSNWQANLMLVAIPMISSMLTFPIWGRLVDKLGCRPVLLIAGVLITHGAISWAFVTHDGWHGDSWWIGYMAVLSAAMAWPGVELASQNLLLQMADTDTNKAGGSAYVAVHSVVIGIAGSLSGIFGGTIAETLKDWHDEWMGMTVTYHGLLFLISAGIRLASLVWLIGMPEPQSYTARAALRYMVASIYTQVQVVVVAPFRGLAKLKRFTFRK